MDDDLKITFADDEGVVKDFFIVSSFDHPYKDRHYTIYTDYEPDEENNITYYAAYQDGKDDQYYMVDEDEDWNLVNEVLMAFLDEDE